MSYGGSLKERRRRRRREKEEKLKIENIEKS